MPTKVTDFNGGVALTSLQDSDILYFIRGGTDQFGAVSLLRQYLGLIPFDVTLTPAQILNSNTAPIDFIPAPGANKIVKLVEFEKLMTYVSAAYDTNIGCLVRHSGGNNIINGFFINQTTNSYIDFVCGLGEGSGFGLDYTQMAVNESIQFMTNVGNPTAGNSPIRLKGYYRIIDL